MPTQGLPDTAQPSLAPGGMTSASVFRGGQPRSNLPTGRPGATRATGSDTILGIEARVRTRCRDRFYRERILQRIVPDIAAALDDRPQEATALEVHSDQGSLVPAWLWDPDQGAVAGGANYADAGDIDDPPADDADAWQ